MGIDHQSHVGGVVKMRHLLKGPRSRASELWMTGTTSIEESHRWWGWVVVREAEAKLMGIKWYPWIPINTFRFSQSGDNALPWSMHNCVTIMPYSIIVVHFYCLCFMTHFGLLIANMIIHDFYSFNDSWPLLWPTIDPFLLSVKPTVSNNIHFLYHPYSIFKLIVGSLQSFRWSVCNTYPKHSIIYSLVGTRCIP